MLLKLHSFRVPGGTAWSIFPRSTKYFGASKASFLVNYRVDDLDGLLEELKMAGVEIDPHRDDYDYGRFAWNIFLPVSFSTPSDITPIDRHCYVPESSVWTSDAQHDYVLIRSKPEELQAK
jgi:hypothetical protein